MFISPRCSRSRALGSLSPSWYHCTWSRSIIKDHWDIKSTHLGPSRAVAREESWEFYLWPHMVARTIVGRPRCEVCRKIDRRLIQELADLIVYWVQGLLVFDDSILCPVPTLHGISYTQLNGVTTIESPLACHLSGFYGTWCNRDVQPDHVLARSLSHSSFNIIEIVGVSYRFEIKDVSM